jgi:excisionase family DNA binding protein
MLAASCAVVAWLIFRYALPHDDESIGLPNVEPPEARRGLAVVSEEREAWRVEEVAPLLGVSAVRVQRWLERGLLPGRKVGGLWLVPVVGLRNFLNGESRRS